MGISDDTCSDDDFPWDRDAQDPLDSKYAYVCHADSNAIMNKNSASLEGCVMYVTMFCCNECAKLIIQSGIKKMIFLEDKYHEKWQWVAARRMLDSAGVEYVQFPRPGRRWIAISL